MTKICTEKAMLRKGEMTYGPSYKTRVIIPNFNGWELTIKFQQWIFSDYYSIDSLVWIYVAH